MLRNRSEIAVFWHKNPMALQVLKDFQHNVV